MKDLYLDNFKRNGYDNVSFISGMTDKVFVLFSFNSFKKQLKYVAKFSVIRSGSFECLSYPRA